MKTRFFILESLPAAAVIPPLTSQGPRYHKHNIPTLTGNPEGDAALQQNSTSPFRKLTRERAFQTGLCYATQISKSYMVFVVPNLNHFGYTLSLVPPAIASEVLM